ncbi:hypothetical protein NX86_02795, partial [Streptococcus phocae subsp. salmonis]
FFCCTSFYNGGADIATNIATTNQKITQQSQLLMEMLGQLQGTSTDAQSELDAFLKDLHL